MINPNICEKCEHFKEGYWGSFYQKKYYDVCELDDRRLKGVFYNKEVHKVGGKSISPKDEDFIIPLNCPYLLEHTVNENRAL